MGQLLRSSIKTWCWKAGKHVHVALILFFGHMLEMRLPRVQPLEYGVQWMLIWLLESAQWLLSGA
jgi:hypothetical protein